jgi:UDP-glucose 4-epimerase
VFEASRRAGVRKVSYAESSAIYENTEVFPTPETEIAPQSFYAISKLCTTSFAEAYERFFGLNTTALRYFCVYGPRQDYRRTIPPVMSAFIIKLLKGERPIIYGTGEKRRDFVYVDDVNDFHLLAMTNPRTDGNTYNIGSGVNYSVREIFNLIEGILQTGIEPIYKDDLPGEAEITLADITKAKDIGWEPKIDIQEGLEQMIEYIKTHLLGDISKDETKK